MRPPAKPVRLALAGGAALLGYAAAAQFGFGAPAQVVAAVAAFLIACRCAALDSAVWFFLLPMAVFPVFGVLPAGTVARYYLDPVLFFYLGVFLILTALQKFHFHRWATQQVLRLAGGRPRRLIPLFIALTVLASLAFSGFGAILILAPMVVAINSAFLKSYPEPAAVQATRALTFGTTAAAALAGIGSPIASLPALLLVGLLPQLGGGLHWALTQWVGSLFPLIAAATALLIGLVTWVFFRLPREPLAPGTLTIADARLTPEAVGIVVAALATFGWLVAVDLGALSGADPALLRYLHPAGLVSLFALGLFLWPRRGGELGLLQPEDLAHAPWGWLLTIAGGLALAYAINATGLGMKGYAFYRAATAAHPLLPYLLPFLAALVLAELIGQDLAAILLLPVVGAYAAKSGLPLVPALLVTAAGTTLAFVSPRAVVFYAKLFPSGNFRPRQRLRQALLLKAVMAGLFFAGLLWLFYSSN